VSRLIASKTQDVWLCTCAIPASPEAEAEAEVDVEVLIKWFLVVPPPSSMSHWR